ncbi:hypothetical protein J4212_00175 [Candidatus Woesearchaeota archaeon]|nr:hypothetical protein [Candidatus Woesearchaeota archaeon]
MAVVAIDGMRAHYITHVKRYREHDILVAEDKGVGEWAVQWTLRLSEIQSKIKAGRATAEEIDFYEGSTKPRITYGIQAKKGIYQTGMVLDMEHILNGHNGAKPAAEIPKAADALINAMFNSRSPRHPVFRQLFENYLRRYHPDRL